MDAKEFLKKKGYELVKKIGQGSYAIVYKAIRKSDKRMIAVKIISVAKMEKKHLENSLTEIRIICAIQNPNIVQYFDAFIDETNKDLYLIMEYLGGGDLAGRIAFLLRSKTQSSEKQVWRYILQILQGLKCLHQRKIIHRDIKPGNLFISNDFQTVKIGDLNTSKIMGDKKLTSTVIGTPFYLAPEIWKSVQYDYRCDIFSLGCVIYELATLQPPFKSNSVEELYKLVKRGQYKPLSSKFSKDLRQFINMSLQNNYKLRPSVKKLLSLEGVKSKFKDHTDIDYRKNKVDRCNLTWSHLKTPKNMKEVKEALDSFRNISKGINGRTSFKNKRGHNDLRNQVVKTYLKNKNGSKNTEKNPSAMNSTRGLSSNKAQKKIIYGKQALDNKAHTDRKINKNLKITTTSGSKVTHKSMVLGSSNHTTARNTAKNSITKTVRNNIAKMQNTPKGNRGRRSFKTTGSVKAKLEMSTQSDLKKNKDNGYKNLYSKKAKPSANKHTSSLIYGKSYMKKSPIVSKKVNEVRISKTPSLVDSNGHLLKKRKTAKKVSKKLHSRQDSSKKHAYLLKTPIANSEVAAVKNSNLHSRNDSIEGRLSVNNLKFGCENVQRVEHNTRLNKKSLIPVSRRSNNAFDNDKFPGSKRESEIDDSVYRVNFFDTNEGSEAFGNSLTPHLKGNLEIPLGNITSIQKHNDGHFFQKMTDQHDNRRSQGVFTKPSALTAKHSQSDANLFYKPVSTLLSEDTVKMKMKNKVVENDVRTRPKNSPSPGVIMPTETTVTKPRGFNKHYSLNSIKLDGNGNGHNIPRPKMMSVERNNVGNIIIEEEYGYRAGQNFTDKDFLNSYLNKNLQKK